MHSVADVGAVVITAQEISRRKAFEIALRHNANHDSLTGLYNRRAALRQINRWIEEDETPNARPAVLLLDIDGSRRSMMCTAMRLAMRCWLRWRNGSARWTRPMWAWRLGGDELLLFARYEDAEKQLPQIAVTVLAAMRKPVQAESHWIHTSVSIGIAACPDGGKTADELVRHADLALYQAKDAGRNTVRWFSREAATRLRERTVLRRELERALSGDEFAMHYQPIVDVNSRSIYAHEALLRWHHPQRGLLTARDFIHEIDGAGLTVPLAQWALQAAFRSALASESVQASPIAINVHPRLLQRPDFARNLMQSLSDDNIQPEQIALEITEQDFCAYGGRLTHNIVALADAGIRVVIDDFGTGFSNFGYLTRFPGACDQDRPRICRPDWHQCAVRDADQCADWSGGGAGHQTIGEGIENAEQSDYLLHQGCVLQQGYYWGRPSAAARRRRCCRTTR